jgi:hypothetical protein
MLVGSKYSKAIVPDVPAGLVTEIVPAPAA